VKDNVAHYKQTVDEQRKILLKQEQQLQLQRKQRKSMKNSSLVSGIETNLYSSVNILS